MRDQNTQDKSQQRSSGSMLTLLYVDLQRVHDRNIIRDRQLTALSLGIPANGKGKVSNDCPIVIEKSSTATSSDNGEFDVEEKTPAPVRYQRLDDRLQFANALVEANAADIIIIDSWPEECLMRNSFPALDQQNEQDSYVMKTGYRANGGRGTMIAIKRKHLVPDDERHNNVGLIGLERLVKRNWMPTPLSKGGCNQAWVHAVDAGQALLNAENKTVRLAVVAFDCGRGYRFQNGLEAGNQSSDQSMPSLYSSKLFMNCRSGSFSNNMGDTSPLLATKTAHVVTSIFGNHDSIKARATVSRSNSTVGTNPSYQNGHRPKSKYSSRNEQGHTWWRASTISTESPNCISSNGTLTEGVTSGITNASRKNSVADSRQATPLDEAEERIRIAGELRQLKSFISGALANQIGDRRRYIERRASETALGQMPLTQSTDGSIALVVGRFGINSLPLTQTLTSCSNTPNNHQECQVNVCDNDRSETLAVVWWRSKNKNGFTSEQPNGITTTAIATATTTNNTNGHDFHVNDNHISINDTTSLLDYNRNAWLDAELESRPRMFTITFH